MNQDQIPNENFPDDVSMHDIKNDKTEIFDIDHKSCQSQENKENLKIDRVIPNEVGGKKSNKCLNNTNNELR